MNDSRTPEAEVAAPHGERVESTGSSRASGRKGIRRPLRILVTVLLVAFIADALVMAVMYGLPPMSPVVGALVDAVMLSVILLPFLFAFVYRPLARQTTEPRRTGEVERVLRGILHAATEAADLASLISEIRDLLGTLIDTTNFYVALYDPATDTYQFPYYADQRDTADPDQAEALPKSLTDYVRRTGEPQLVDDERHAELIERGEVELVGPASPQWIGTPLRTERGVIGVVAVQSYDDPALYSDEDVKVLDAAGGTIAIAVERKRAEEALRRARDDYRAITNLTGDIIVRVDTEGRWTFLSDGACSFWGKSTEELMGAAFADYVHPDDLEKTTADVERCIRGGIVTGSVIRQKTPAGWRTVLWNSSPILEHGEYIGLQATGRDITDEKRAEEELARHRAHLEELVEERTADLEQRVAEAGQLNRAMINLADDLRYANTTLEETAHQLADANQELEAFAYSVSHDLRAPLRHIAGFVDILGENSADTLDETGQRHLRLIAESAGRMGTLIDDLLEFSRAGRVELHVGPLDLGRLSDEVLQEVQARAEGREIVWEVGALPEVMADRATMRQVLVNLLENAVKYTRKTPSARIEIGTAPDAGNELVVFVRDNGVGFDPQYTHKLFGVFQRLHRAEEFEGSGIGLANVRRIISRHGGRTWAEGKLGEGATFFFSLPRKEGEE